MLKVSDLTFQFPHRQLFRDLSFQIRPGHLLHVKGANGVGKSTLVNILCGFLAPTSGEIAYLKDDTTVDELRDYLEYLPSEANGLFLKMNAVANLQFWLSLRGHTVSEAQLNSALEKWGLGHPILKTPFPVERYSTGMKRRLALARLTLSTAPFWLLDEPIYGLDAEATEIFATELKHHLEQGGLALMVTHETGILADLPHETLILGGKP